MAIGSHLNKMREANALALAKLTFFNICNSLGHPHPYNENPPAAQNLLRHIYVSFPGHVSSQKNGIETKDGQQPRPNLRLITPPTTQPSNRQS